MAVNTQQVGKTAAVQPLASKWDGLNDYLLADFFLVKRVRANKGGGEKTYWHRVEDAPFVQAPLVESNLEATLNWQSPFEQSGAETKAPALLALMQSGGFQPFIDAIRGGTAALGNLFGSETWNKMATQSANASSKYLEEFQDRSGITRLNSTQIFTGMQPIKIQVKALFRAWRDPVAEVDVPVNQLWAWALPQELAEESTLASRMANKLSQSEALSVLMPSKAPLYVGMTYKRRTYQPLVIESIDLPIGGPITQEGFFAEMPVSMTLCSLTAIDQRDWAAGRA